MKNTRVEIQELQNNSELTEDFRYHIAAQLFLPGGCEDRSTEIERPFTRQHGSYLKNAKQDTGEKFCTEK